MPIRAVDERVLPFAPDQIWTMLADVNGYPRWYPPSLHLHIGVKMQKCERRTGQVFNRESRESREPRYTLLPFLAKRGQENAYMTAFF